MRPFAADTHSGLKRSQNEDCYEADPELDLWLVADGVGGHSCGEVASDIVRTTIRDDIAQGSGLVAAIEHSHRAILEEIEHTASTRGMGSTVVALCMDGDNYELAWVGDSRAYLFHQGALERITQDHSMVADMIRQGTLTEEDSRVHPNRSVITRALGSDPNMFADTYEVDADPGDTLLLCSDGLTSMLTVGHALLVEKMNVPSTHEMISTKASMPVVVPSWA